MEKISKNEPLPLKLLHDFEQEYPDAFPLCDYVRKGKGVELRDWHDICLMPISATLSIGRKIGAGGLFPSVCAALYSWKKHKEIYNFDKDLADMLMSQADSELEIPIEVLFSIPYHCVWIQYEEKNGFFAWIEQDMHTYNFELRILSAIKEGFTESIAVHLVKDGSVLDGIKEAFAEIKRNAPSYIIDQELVKYQSDLAAKYLQLILYLCAENKEAQCRNKKYYRGKKVTRDFSQPRTWDVGYRIGNIIRKHNEAQIGAPACYDDDDISQADRIGNHKPKRPHTRRGHYHHYWIGSEKDNSRKVILKWVAPMFIGGSDDDIIPTEHKAK